MIELSHIILFLIVLASIIFAVIIEWKIKTGTLTLLGNGHLSIAVILGLEFLQTTLLLILEAFYLRIFPSTFYEKFDN